MTHTSWCPLYVRMRTRSKAGDRQTYMSYSKSMFPLNTTDATGSPIEDQRQCIVRVSQKEPASDPEWLSPTHSKPYCSWIQYIIHFAFHPSVSGSSRPRLKSNGRLVASAHHHDWQCGIITWLGQRAEDGKSHSSALSALSRTSNALLQNGILGV